MTKQSKLNRVSKDKQEFYKGWDITEEQRAVYSERSRQSSKARALALKGKGPKPIHPINTPKLRPKDLMPQIERHELRSLSLFSGCGGIDIGFDRAGFTHIASYDILEVTGKTIPKSRPDWKVFCGESGDVRNVNWQEYKGLVDVLHGGPPCQPFSIAGRQKGKNDSRDMFPEFVRAVLEIEPKAFVAENVKAVTSPKFSDYVKRVIEKPLEKKYKIFRVVLEACRFGVPQTRKRAFFVGISRKLKNAIYEPPKPTHHCEYLKAKKSDICESNNNLNLERCLGVREALGLPEIGFDALSPTIRSGFTGPRNTTSILNSTSGQKYWAQLEIWPNGVAITREKAHLFLAKNKHFRLSVPDCKVIQGFPESWEICGPVYMALGQIGNAVPPPMSYQIALSIKNALL